MCSSDLAELVRLGAPAGSVMQLLDDVGVVAQAPGVDAGLVRALDAQARQAFTDGAVRAVGPSVGLARSRPADPAAWQSAGHRVRVWTVNSGEDLTLGRPADTRRVLELDRQHEWATARHGELDELTEGEDLLAAPTAPGRWVGPTQQVESPQLGEGVLTDGSRPVAGAVHGLVVPAHRYPVGRQPDVALYAVGTVRERLEVRGAGVLGPDGAGSPVGDQSHHLTVAGVPPGPRPPAACRPGVSPQDRDLSPKYPMGYDERPTTMPHHGP